MNLYRQPDHRDEVVTAYTQITGSKEIATIILDACVANHVPPGLAFALVATESDFNPRALGWNSTSRDYGLFQLNSRTYPQLSASEAFDPVVNAALGTAHIRDSLDRARNLPEALAIYNAGPTRVQMGLIPPTTKLYVKKILALKDQYESNFMDRIMETKVLVMGMKSSKAPGSLLDIGLPF